MMALNVEVYIARHERYEAVEAYVSHLSEVQAQFLKDNEADFRLIINTVLGNSQLLMIEDEG